MIAFSCPACQKQLTVKDELAGKRGKCPGCQQPLLVPKGPALQGAPRSTRTSTARTRQPDSIPAAPAGSSAKSRPATQGMASSDEATLAPLRPAQDVSREHYDFLAPPQAPDELGRLGPYRILQVLGAGGMGVVFLGEDPQLERKVALKAMLPTLAASDSARQRFLREAKTAAAIEHDHIVPIYQVGEDRGVPFIAMPLLRGEPLDERLKREPVPPLSETLRIGRETAKGLAAAHERGLIHRDIKPANLWLEGPEGRVKILDFGLARAAADSAQLTQSGAILGTPAFMAPEQAQGGAVDGRCDLFSLGCVLYRMTTGKLPFKGADTISTLMAVATENPRPPVEIDPEVPAVLSELVMALLAKKPEDRPASAREVVAALAEIEGGGEARTVALQASRPRKGGKKKASAAAGKGFFSGRKAYLAAGGAVAAVVLLAVVLVVTLRRGSGTLVVTVQEPGVKVFVDGQEKVVIDSQKVGRVELSAGKHQLVVKRGQEELYTKDFTLKSGGEVVLDASWTPTAAAGAEKQDSWEYGDIGDLRLARPEDRENVKSVPPPENAVVLFDGKSLDGWAQRKDGQSPAQWKLLPGGIIQARGGDIQTLQKFAGPFKLHVEFRVPYMPNRHGQGRGNSGVYIQGRYEVQILDSYGLVSKNNDCGAIYSIAAPRVNACKAPGVWQSYDIEFTPPKCRDGKKRAPGRMTISHNGVKIHEDAELTKDYTDRGMAGDPCSPGPIVLQDHGDPVQLRNIWLLPAEEGRTSFFNGRNLNGWEGRDDLWTVQDGAIVGSTPQDPGYNTCLCSQKEYRDFDLSFKVCLRAYPPGAGNSGVQIRSKLVDSTKYVVHGPQADIGAGYWGSLYGEGFGGMMRQAPADKVNRVVKDNDFNDYSIRCIGKHVVIKINGETMVDDTFAQMPEEGIIAFQLHAGFKSMEVTFKDLRFEDLSKP